MERIEATVSGRVQMVMYRDFVCRNARKLGLVGEVENLLDGTVRVIAEGNRDALLKLIVRMHKGSLLSHVTNVRVEWKPVVRSYSSFSITYR